MKLEAYIGKEPELKGVVEVDFKDLPLINPLEEKTYICYSTDIPKFFPQNFILILQSATPLKIKKLKEMGFKIYEAKGFDMKRIFTDKNRQEVFEDLKKIEPLHLYSISRNFQKIPDFDMEKLSIAGSLIYSVDNKYIKAMLIFGIKPTVLPVLRY